MGARVWLAYAVFSTAVAVLDLGAAWWGAAPAGWGLPQWTSALNGAFVAGYAAWAWRNLGERRREESHRDVRR